MHLLESLDPARDQVAIEHSDEVGVHQGSYTPCVCEYAQCWKVQPSCRSEVGRFAATKGHPAVVQCNSILGVDSPFFSTIVLFKQPPLSPGFAEVF